MQSASWDDVEQHIEQIEHLVIQGNNPDNARFAYFESDKDTMQAANMLNDDFAVTTKTARVFTKYMNYSVDQAKDEMEICRQMNLIQSKEERLEAAITSRNIRFEDKATVNELTKEGLTQEKAALKHLNVLKLPAEEHKLTTE